MGAAKKQKSVFVSNIVRRRKAFGWSAMKLAEKAEIGYPTLRDIEAGIHHGRLETHEAIAKALGCTVSDLHANEHREHLTAEDLGRALQGLMDAPIVRQTVVLFLLTRDRAYLARLPDKLRPALESLNLE